MKCELKRRDYVNLWRVYIERYDGSDSELYVAETQEDAIEKALADNEECYYVIATLVEEVDGYKIILKKN